MKRIYVAEFGYSEGAMILFLHGGMVSGWMWTEQVADLPRVDRSHDIA